MGAYSFVKTPVEVKHFKETVSWMNECEGLFAVWATDPEAIKRVLPEPLTLAAPVAVSYVINAYDPNFSTAYKEAALLVPAMCGDKGGLYTLSMLLEGSDNAITTGREELGIPKKNADSIELYRSGDVIHASITRMGIKLFEADAEIGDYNSPMAAQVFGDRSAGKVLDGQQFFYKYELEQGPKAELDVKNLRLLGVHNQMKYKGWENASLEVKLTPAPCDPWAELVCAKPLGAGWTKLDIGLLGLLFDKPMDAKASEGIVPKLLASRFDTPLFGQPNRMIG
jgi:acetoacetate decarboxylase